MYIVIRRSDKRIWVNSIGNTERDDVKANQEEKVRLVFHSEATNTIAKLANGSTITVGIKATKDATEYIASTSDFTVDGQHHIGWLDLRNDAALALNDGAKCYLEVWWTESGHEERSETLELTISKGVILGDEDLPVNGNADARAAWLAAHIIAGDNVTITPDYTAGTITVAGEAGGGGSITYAAGFASTVISGTTYKWPVSRVP